MANKTIVVGHGTAAVATNTTVSASATVTADNTYITCADTSTSTIILRKWLWELVDSNGATSSSATTKNHTFDSPASGSYTIRLTVTNKMGATATYSTVPFNFTLSAVFSAAVADNTVICLFTSISSGTAQSLTWTLYDDDLVQVGSPQTTTNLAETITFAGLDAGSYSVILSITTSTGVFVPQAVNDLIILDLTAPDGVTGLTIGSPLTVNSIPFSFTQHANTDGDLENATFVLDADGTSTPDDVVAGQAIPAVVVVGLSVCISAAPTGEFVGVWPAATYKIRGFAQDSAGNASAYSSTIDAEVVATPDPPDPPLARLGFVMAQNGPGNNIGTWTIPPGGDPAEVQYLKRRPAGGAFAVVGGPLFASATTATDSSAAQGVTYDYLVAAVNESGTTNSAISTVTTEQSSGTVPADTDDTFQTYADVNELVVGDGDLGIEYTSTPSSKFSLGTDGGFMGTKYSRRTWTGVATLGSNFINDETIVVKQDFPGGAFSTVREVWLEYTDRMVNWHCGIPNRTCVAVNNVSGSFSAGDTFSFSSGGSTCTLFKVFSGLAMTSLPSATHTLVFNFNGFVALPPVGATVTGPDGTATVVSSHTANDNPAYKHCLVYTRAWGGGLNSGGNSGRFDLETYNGTNQTWQTVRGWTSSETILQGRRLGPAHWSIDYQSHGDWVTWREHIRLNSAQGVPDGTFAVWYKREGIDADFVLLYDYGLINADYGNFWYIQWGANRNEQQLHTMHKDDGRRRRWFSNPGW